MLTPLAISDQTNYGQFYDLDSPELSPEWGGQEGLGSGDHVNYVVTGCVHNEGETRSAGPGEEWAAWEGSEHLSWGRSGRNCAPPAQNSAEGGLEGGKGPLPAESLGGFTVALLPASRRVTWGVATPWGLSLPHRTG